ncbi:AtzE family amidohydrolase [Aquariibacter albus]|uniref:AtzE family amidohydrolase n=1 Tax=Aquariibacter albus TaxID=2759899 RepID=A0A839HM93_9BURK|nr:AtzE family amidohydrolase [Aquariibacter albus]MBB1160688.1 AtzE family amidohydrolase [Aquariibacter albus]
MSPAVPRDAACLARQVRQGELSARAAVEHSLARIAATDGRVNAFTAVLAERALRRAERIDRHAHRSGLSLAGVPFAAKNLFDIAGLPTLAGSRIEADSPPAARDALLIRRLEAAGAILVGALNMDEYAYGFTTENSHVGPTRNPHDLGRSAGGSSGGCGAAVAAGQVPLTIGSDTNGSIRVPSSKCGIFGLKPTFGRLPRHGSFPFVPDLDHLGPFASSARDLALSYDAMQGPDAADPGCDPRPAEPVLRELGRGLDGLRSAVLGGWFERMAQPAARTAVARVAAALGTRRRAELPEVEAGRAAAFLITNAQAGNLHLPNLRRRPDDFEPLIRDRLLAGALLPAAWLQQAHRMRRRFAEHAARLFAQCELLIAPATPCVAQPLGTEWIELDGQRLPARPNFGVMSQPISCIGLPVVTVPVWGCDAAQPHLPIGVQLIAAPWCEGQALRAAAALEAAGVCSAPVAALN